MSKLNYTCNHSDGRQLVGRTHIQGRDYEIWRCPCGNQKLRPYNPFAPVGSKEGPCWV